MIVHSSAEKPQTELPKEARSLVPAEARENPAGLSLPGKTLIRALRT